MVIELELRLLQLELLLNPINLSYFTLLFLLLILDRLDYYRVFLVGLLNFHGEAEVTNPGYVILREKDIERLQVSVDVVLVVHVLHAEADVYEQLPDERLRHQLRGILLY